MIEAVLFDLDGTLLNTLPDLHYITNATLAEFGYPERSMEEIRMFVGNGVRLLMQRALPEGVQLTEDMMDCMIRNYLKYQNLRVQKYDGIDEMLAELKKMGVRSAIVSNKPDPAAIEVWKQYFSDTLDFAIGARDGLRTKPSPDTPNEAMKFLGVKPENCVYVGDSDTDILTGTNAGMETLSVTWGFRGEEFLLSHGAKHLVRTPGEIVAYVRERR